MTATFRDAVQWAITQLTGDATLTSLGVTGSYFYQAPETATRPYIILQKQTGSTQSVLGGATGYNRHWLAVKCVSNGQDGGDIGRQVVDRVNTLLSYKTATVASGKILSVMPQTDFEYSDAERGNQLYIHVGSVFVVWLG